MTGNVFFDGIFIFLIAYAIISMLHELADAFQNRFSRCHPKDCVVLVLSHGTESLECDVRMALRRSYEMHCALIIVDTSLDSDEKMILWRLTDPCDHVLISTSEQLMETIETAQKQLSF